MYSNVVYATGVFLLTAIANRFRLKPINLQEQFIMAYGGLRGAVSFSLVEMLTPDVIKPRQMFVTTTLAVILFTVFVQVNRKDDMSVLHTTVFFITFPAKPRPLYSVLLLGGHYQVVCPTPSHQER